VLTRRQFLKVSMGARPVSSSIAWEANLWPEEGTSMTRSGYCWKEDEGRR
jgi:hypothetical protein